MTERLIVAEEIGGIGEHVIVKYIERVRVVISREEMFPAEVLEFEKICAARQVLNDGERKRKNRYRSTKNSGT